MRLSIALLLGSLSSLVYIAGRPVQTEYLSHETEHLSHETGRLSLQDAGTSSSSTPTYEDIQMPGGDTIRLTHSLLDDIWASQFYANADKDKANANAVRRYRNRKYGLGLKTTGALPPHQKIQTVSGEDRLMSRDKTYKRRIKYVGLKVGDPRRKQYRKVPYNSLKEGYEAYKRDRTNLSREMEIKKAYAKYAIANQRVMIDEQSQTLLPMTIRTVGRPRRKEVTPTILRSREYYARKKEELRAARNARQMYAEQEEQENSDLSEPDWQPEGKSQVRRSRRILAQQYQFPQQWSQSRPRSRRTRSASQHNTFNQQDEPELVWPKTARRHRTARVPVNNDASGGIHYDDNEYEPDLVWPNTARRLRTPRVVVGDEDWEDGYDDEYDSATMSHVSSSTLSRTPSAGEYIQSPLSSPTRLRNDGLHLDLNIRAEGEYNSDGS